MISTTEESPHFYKFFFLYLVKDDDILKELFKCQTLKTMFNVLFEGLEVYLVFHFKCFLSILVAVLND